MPTEPCKRCGSRLHFPQGRAGEAWFACGGCGHEGPQAGSFNAAATAWNEEPAPAWAADVASSDDWRIEDHSHEVINDLPMRDRLRLLRG